MSEWKAGMRSWLRSKRFFRSIYSKPKRQAKRLWLLRYFLYDIADTYKAMFWPMDASDRTTLSAAMLFQYHKLEKGLVMPGPERMFGVEPARATMTLARRWLAAGHRSDDPVFLGAVQTLDSYARRLDARRLDADKRLSGEIAAFLSAVTVRDTQLQTPMRLPEARPQDGVDWSFLRLAESRRSVRDYLPHPVPRQLIESAAAAAQLAPSACNRQPCRLIVVSDSEKRRRMLALQNGNRGFGHLAPHVVVCAADAGCFFDASERHEPYIDGGLFAMSFILALRDLGISSCCLNWCVHPRNDHLARAIIDIPESHRILMLIAIGYAPADCHVPRSPRRSLEEVLMFQ